LIGAYFSKEYSIEAASLFNPSMVIHPDQTGLNKTELRFILSVRATGEGHLSSISFREGIIKNDEVTLIPATPLCELPKRIKHKYLEKNYINEVLITGWENLVGIASELPDLVTVENAKGILRKNPDRKVYKKLFGMIRDAAEANYDIEFAKSTNLSERIIFPFSKSELMGMEDARFVKFENDDGSFLYYGTYTAFNGKTFRVQLLETSNFRDFKVRTLHGRNNLDKGIAIFPRKINGRYAVVSRLDGENLYFMNSENLYKWDDAPTLLYEPRNSFEFIQTGNCGSPIETKDGWLLITHSVGPFRRYVISALLLDPDDPSKIVASLDTPLLFPREDEREGYVPNVVYSCGSILHNDYLIIPYAMSDSCCGFAKIKLDELLNRMKQNSLYSK
jgi:predicted GH43/DUF377 family glycosyl hydrolase